MACTKKYFISGEQILNTELFNITDFDKGKSLYEVVKVTEGKALFSDAHIKRLRHSANISNKMITYSDKKIYTQIQKLIEINKVQTGRLKFLFRYTKNQSKFFSFFLNDITPDSKTYTQGVKTVFYNAERISPSVKMIDYDLRRNVKLYTEQRNAFEALLVNIYSEVTEGSKSNFFGIRNNVVYTTPVANVLAGITRDYVFKICNELNIKLVEKNISVEDILTFNSAFLSGTSIGILPVKEIENHKLTPSDPILNMIGKAYQRKALDYIKSFQPVL